MIIFFIKAYQKLISPFLPANTCRFFPTCSSYAIEAIMKFGNTQGILLSLKRLFRCHPLNPGGYDPIP